MFFKDDRIPVTDRVGSGKIEKVTKSHYIILWDGHKNSISYEKDGERFWEISPDNYCIHNVKKLEKKGKNKNTYIYCEKCGKSRIYGD